MRLAFTMISTFILTVRDLLLMIVMAPIELLKAIAGFYG
jgi:hypothetical protein